MDLTRYPSILTFLNGTGAPYLGKPILSVLTTMGDGIGEFANCAFASGELSLSEHGVAERLLSAISAAFLAPERILEPGWRTPTRVFPIIDSIAQQAATQEVAQRARHLHQSLMKPPGSR
jgi:hypothetical protein